MPIYKNDFLQKTEVEDCILLSTKLLNREGSFKNSTNGTLEWSNHFGTYFSASYEVLINPIAPLFKLSFLLGDTHNKQEFTNYFGLDTTLCNFSGERYWLICRCGKRVGNIYKPNWSNNFACRCKF